ncbi:LacI family DNA-binding transcriptional regulator [Nonomuraea sp. MCN248]|uniref:LacI family DNA-binding transcriptional regulator n=1 Tax=Nonomuraea corallina TaxID=2989783 RepID=A0ABT4SMI1_9ACTN|nr:LacI family DNA-binding transcriptional regulator [Nonomuraea corallina]MDA0638384.1 LacI family DNA-binding transcriptional regulator [Nonomuraea corallina]
MRRNGLADTRPRRPTLETVAARAKVSRATVSRVVNGDAAVSPEVRESVLRAVKELGYVPNAAARSLATRRTDTVALVLSIPRQDDALTAAVVQYVTSVLEGAGKRIILMLADTSESHRRIAGHVEARLADGVVLLPTDGADPLAERLARTDAPLVLLGRPAINSLVPYVDADNAGGAAAATEHLLRQGRRRIGLICGPTHLVAVQDRMAGHRDALQRAGLLPHVSLADDTAGSGAAALARLLADERRLDAVLATSDHLAIGALRGAAEAGRRVPDDLAVVGFGDIEAAAYTTPALTTVRTSPTEQAMAVARLMLSRLEGRHTTPVVLPARLVTRSSA